MRPRLGTNISGRVQNLTSKMADDTRESVNGIIQKKSNVWAHDEDIKLLEKVEEHLGNVSEEKNLYIKDIVWSEVRLDGRDETEVHKRWNTLTSKIRKKRTANEVLEDAKKKVADQKKTRKRKRDDRDPSLPKMPLTAYLLFCEQKRPRLAQKYGNKEVMGKLAKKWSKLSDEKKEKYKEMYRESRQKYEHDIVQYYVDHYPNETPPKNAFDLWSLDKAAEIKKSRPDISEKKLKKKLKRYWEQLEDKEQWEKKAKKEVDKFIKAMKRKG